MSASPSPGPLLRALRQERRLTQETLALRAEVSLRHLSFVENGRAQPSRTMLLRLADALHLPLRVRNHLLTAGGFAASIRTPVLDDPVWAPVNAAIERWFEQHDPHPVLILDRGWNLVRASRAAWRIFAWCGVPMEKLAHANVSVLHVLFDPAWGLRAAVENFDAVADFALARLRHEAFIDPSLRGLVGELERLRGPVAHAPTAHPPDAVVLPIHLRRGGDCLRYFTMLSTLGTPLDAIAHELRVETYLPLDAETTALAGALARGDVSSA
ncbi:MAG: helix-turn-helix transcriptional regulator [Verrucomicrobia bacterium]|nr:helix-turn-helix transcriptional regulator [Verrucomicrobiota bacterium]